MPLPPALQARLAKRGIIHKGKVILKGCIWVFDFVNVKKKSVSSLKVRLCCCCYNVDKEKADEPSGVDGPVKGCPNTSNPYHTCVEYCRKRYGENAIAPQVKVRVKRFCPAGLATCWIQETLKSFQSSY